MLGFLSKTKSNKTLVNKESIYFISIPEGLSQEDIKDRFAQLAQTFANKMDVNTVYLIYGKDEFIKYEYSI